MKARASTLARYSGALRTYLFPGLPQCVGLAVLSGSVAGAPLRYEMGPKGLLIESVDSNCPRNQGGPALLAASTSLRACIFREN